MKIESVDFYYLSMPIIRDIGDGSQDVLLVRVQAGADVGWGECEASPLVSIAALVAPMSHSACKPVLASVLGQRLDDVPDIRRIGDLVRANSLDLLQADHTLSGIDIALWDLLGKRLNVPVYQLLGDDVAVPKIPYASQLFGDDPYQTHERAVATRNAGFMAAKFGWGPFGQTDVATDAGHVRAAREGLGDDAALLVDAGTVWGEDIERAAAVLPVLEECRVTWLEEPFVSGATRAYQRLARRSASVRLAAGEGSHNAHMARNLIDADALGYIQIDAGRIGGITPARDVAIYARDRDVTYVNHAFTSHLALSASLQPFAGSTRDVICEYPVDATPLARAITQNHIERDDAGLIRIPDRPGLGMTLDLAAAKSYLVDAEIRVGNALLYRTPELAD